MYFDTSVLVAYYCPEPLSGKSEKSIRSAKNPTISSLCEVEFFSVLSRKVRQDELDSPDARLIANQFSEHLGMQLFHYIPLERRHYQLARDLIAGFDTPLRTLDSLHLAVAYSEHLTLVTADSQLAQIARSFSAKVKYIS